MKIVPSLVEMRKPYLVLICALSAGTAWSADAEGKNEASTGAGAPVAARGAGAVERNRQDDLFNAMSNNSIEDVEETLKNGADPNKPLSGGGPVWREIEYITAPDTVIIRILEKLIQAGANVNYTDSSGETILHALGQTMPGTRELRMVELLLKNGADANIKDRNDKTPYDYANALLEKLKFDNSAEEEIIKNTEKMADLLLNALTSATTTR